MQYGACIEEHGVPCGVGVGVAGTGVGVGVGVGVVGTVLAHGEVTFTYGKLLVNEHIPNRNIAAIMTAPTAIASPCSFMKVLLL